MTNLDTREDRVTWVAARWRTSFDSVTRAKAESLGIAADEIREGIALRERHEKLWYDLRMWHGDPAYGHWTFDLADPKDREYLELERRIWPNRSGQKPEVIDSREAA